VCTVVCTCTNVVSGCAGTSNAPQVNVRCFHAHKSVLDGRVRVEVQIKMEVVQRVFCVPVEQALDGLCRLVWGCGALSHAHMRACVPVRGRANDNVRFVRPAERCQKAHHVEIEQCALYRCHCAQCRYTIHCTAADCATCVHGTKCRCVLFG
jgi:hypothetical protein